MEETEKGQRGYRATSHSYRSGYLHLSANAGTDSMVGSSFTVFGIEGGGAHAAWEPARLCHRLAEISEKVQVVTSTGWAMG